MKKKIIIVLLLIILIAVVDASPKYKRLAQLNRLDRVLDHNQTQNEMTFGNLTVVDIANITILYANGTLVTPNEYIKNETDASLKNLNVTGKTSLQGTLNMNNNTIRDIRELINPDGSAITNMQPDWFSGGGQAVLIISNQTLGAGVTVMCILDSPGEKVIVCWQAGGNNSGAYERNSGGNFPDLEIKNATKLTNMVEMFGRFGIESNLDYFSGANRTSRAVLYAFEGQQLHLHDDLGHGLLEVEGDINFFLRADTDFDIFGRMHIEQNRTEEIGISIGGEKSALDVSFIVGGQIDPFERIGALVAGHWVSTTESECHDMQCAVARGTGASSDFAMAINFSLNDLENCNVSFWVTTTALDSGDRFRVTINNNTGSGDYEGFNITDGSNIEDIQINISLPAEHFFNASKVTLTFNLSANNPINEMAFVDDVKVSCIATTTTRENVTRFDGEMIFGQTGLEQGRIFWNDTALQFEITGDILEQNLIVVNETVTGRFTVGPDKVNISNAGDVNATKFYGDGSALTGIGGSHLENGTDANLTNLIVSGAANEYSLELANDELTGNQFAGTAFGTANGVAQAAMVFVRDPTFNVGEIQWWLNSFGDRETDVNSNSDNQMSLGRTGIFTVENLAAGGAGTIRVESSNFRGTIQTTGGGVFFKFGTTSDDDKLGIFDTSANRLNFVANDRPLRMSTNITENSGYIQIDDVTGNVGIGLGEPSSKLDINGSMNVSNITLSGAAILANSDSAGVLTLGSTGGAQNNRMTLDFEANTARVHLAGVKFVYENDITIADELSLEFGNIFTSDVKTKWEATGNFDHLETGLRVNNAAFTGFWSIMNRDDLGNVNRRPVSFTADPRLRIYSSDVSEVFDYIEIQHDQTSGVINASGGIALAGGLVSSEGISINETTGFTGTCADGTSITVSGGIITGCS